jgi:hypothetical protein
VRNREFSETQHLHLRYTGLPTAGLSAAQRAPYSRRADDAGYQHLTGTKMTLSEALAQPDAADFDSILRV